MRKLDKAPSIPGAGNPGNLVQDGCGEGVDMCPACGAAWKGGRPWSEVTLKPSEVAEKLGVTVQCVNQRIRSGTIAALLRPSRGGRNVYLVPIFEVKRLLEEKGQSTEVQDLGAVEP